MSNDKVFANLSELVATDDNIDDQISQIESLCMNCGQNGTTRLLMTEIPFFRQVVIMSFECPHCHYTNNELQPAQQIAERGVRFAVNCDSAKDLMRRVVKTEWAEIAIPEIEFEVKKQTGLITTVEGILDRAVEGLQQTIRASSDHDSESRQKICDFLVKLNNLKNGNDRFTFVITDISGNSFVENLCAPDKDPKIEITHFDRSREEDRLLGIYANEDSVEEPVEETQDKADLKNEVLQFPTNCPNCNAPVYTNMKVTDIPHFREIIIMATNCESCGHKTNEVKSGAGVGEKGVIIRLKVDTEEDLKKEVSETCRLTIPELDIHISSTGSGRYTTVEGLGLAIIEDLKRTNPFIEGDSTEEEVKNKLSAVFDKLSNLIGYTVIMDDPCGNSYVEDAKDVQRYERTFEQNEELGINDMKTDNY